jgi:hypothetical protein
LTQGGKRFYYVDGTYYTPSYSGGSVAYEAVQPPAGLVVTSIPSDGGSLVVDGRKYYYAGGVFYTETTKEGRPAYIVSAGPSGEAAAQLAAEDPDPFEILSQMSDFIGAVNSFSVTGIATVEGVLDSGQKVHFSNTRTISVRRPDRLFSMASGDVVNRSTWYDGKQVSVLDRQENVYGRVDVPPTIDETLDFVAREYGHTLPLSDLFYSDVYEAVTPDIESAVYLGLHKVGPIDCHHLALSGEAIDAEVWIQEGDEPLIRKIAITDKRDEYGRDFVATLNWDLEAAYTDDYFVFTPPQDAEEIEVKPVEYAEEGEPAEETEEVPA